MKDPSRRRQLRSEGASPGTLPDAADSISNDRITREKPKPAEAEDPL